MLGVLQGGCEVVMHCVNTLYIVSRKLGAYFGGFNGLRGQIPLHLSYFSMTLLIHLPTMNMDVTAANNSILFLISISISDLLYFMCII